MAHTLIIAEAGVNHNGDISIAKQLVDVAADSGADYVKFQTFKAEKMVTRLASKAGYQMAGQDPVKQSTQFDMLKSLELDTKTHQLLIDHCQKKKIGFLSTAFDLDSIDLISELGIPFFKVPSGEITNLPYLKKIAGKGKPVVLSTGMATLQEVVDAFDLLTTHGVDREKITVLHCNTEYPTPIEDVNLKAMLTLQKELNVDVGYSDHTLGIEVPIAAVAMGATVIEKHFTIDKSMKGPDHKSSLEPGELKAMVSAIRNIELAKGNGFKTPSPSEIKNLKFARKSIHLARDVSENHKVTESDLIMKRPGDGISPMQLDLVIGKKIIKNLKADHQLTWEDFS